MNWSNTAKTTDAPRRWALVVMVVVLVSTAVAPTAAAADVEQQGENCQDCYRVDAIVIEGLLRTGRGVVERELLFEEGDVVSRDEVEESVQRLRNTGIFRTVDYTLSDGMIGAYDDNPGGRGEDRGRLLRLSVDERYTVSPSFRFGHGGSTLHLMLGVSDINLGGSFLQGGLRYSRLGDANSFSIWFSDPRFLDARQSVTLRAGINNQIYTLFDDDGEVDGGYLRVRHHGSVGYGKEWKRWLRTSVGASFSANSFSYDMVGDQRSDAQRSRGGLYGHSQTLGVELTGRLGKIDRFEHRRRGTALRLSASQNLHFGDHEPQSRRFRSTLRHYQWLPFDITVATRTSMGLRTSGIPTYEQFFGGGLNIIRGTFNKRHRGIHNWFNNVELRVPAFTNRWLIVQGVGFLDAVTVGDEPGDLFGLTAATTGVGLRLISRDFHGMIIRLDYAPSVMGADGPGVSFGAGQFF